MAESNSDKIFRTKVLPIMNKVSENLRSKQATELESKQNSMAFWGAAAAGPDGGASAMQAVSDTVYYTGKWNTKTVEDYIAMVKTELKKQHITVDAAMEKKMIDKMVKDQMPKSSIDYIIRKAATNTIFYLPQELRKSQLQQHIDQKAEEAYKPKAWEKGVGIALGSVSDWASTGGFGGGWKSAATFIGTDMAVSAVPLVIAPEHREEYAKTQAKKKDEPQKQKEQKPENKPQTVEQKPEDKKSEDNSQENTASPTPQDSTDQKNQQQAEQTNQDGWSGLLSSFGLNGLTDVGNNLGYVLAMLPDVLLGAFTGKSTSLGFKDNLMPIASIVAGMFVKNPILKMVLIGMGGLNLMNKAGHEAINDHKGLNQQTQSNGTVHSMYRVYEDEELNGRIIQPEIKGNCLIATIDRVPCTIALPDKVVDAYNQGALPLNTLANAVLAKNDQMRQTATERASENYAATEQQTIIRPLAQR